MLVNGDLDHLPEQAFFNVGGAEDAMRKAEELEKDSLMSLVVELVSPERVAYSGEAKMVICRTTTGDIAFLPGHVPVHRRARDPPGAGAARGAAASRSSRCTRASSRCRPPRTATPG